MNNRLEQYNLVIEKLKYFQLIDHPFIENILKLLENWVIDSFSIKKNILIPEINRILSIKTDKNNYDVLNVVLKCV